MFHRINILLRGSYEQAQQFETQLRSLNITQMIEEAGGGQISVDLTQHCETCSKESTRSQADSDAHSFYQANKPAGPGIWPLSSVPKRNVADDDIITGFSGESGQQFSSAIEWRLHLKSGKTIKLPFMLCTPTYIQQCNHLIGVSLADARRAAPQLFAPR